MPVQLTESRDAAATPTRGASATFWASPHGGSKGTWPTGSFRLGPCYRFLGGRTGTRQRGRSEWTGPGQPRFLNEPLGDVRRVLATTATAAGSAAGLSAGGWVGYFSYDLGRVLEPATQGPGQPADDRGWPLIELYRCEGGPSAPPDGMFHVEHPGDDPPGGGARLGVLESRTGRKKFVSAAARAIEYIRAGDVFQVNLAHRLSGPFSGSVDEFYRRVVARAQPWHGVCLQGPDGDGRTRRAIVSMSPELFLRYDARTRRVVTRPMKGTRPGTADPRELEGSLKDRAELNMIIDLMRNDLGRVCNFGTVRVETPRAIESHGAACAPALRGAVPVDAAATSPALWQATGTVSGELREGLDVCDLLRATFPPGSVTGAPKIRAMQIIDELEPVARGPYCGCIGWIGDDGSAAFSVAIRTALINGMASDRGPAWIEDGVLDYSVGAGIVADSDPEAEWRETLDKAGVLGA